MAAERLQGVLGHLKPTGVKAFTQKNPDDIVVTCALRTPLTKAGKGGLKDTPFENVLISLMKASPAPTRPREYLTLIKQASRAPSRSLRSTQSSLRILSAVTSMKPELHIGVELLLWLRASQILPPVLLSTDSALPGYSLFRRSRTRLSTTLSRLVLLLVLR